MIGLVPRYQCDGCGLYVDGPVSWKHGTTPPTTQPSVFPIGWEMRWINESASGGPVGYLAWCPSCVRQLGVDVYKREYEEAQQADKVRYTAANAAWNASLEGTVKPKYPDDPLMADYHRKKSR